jgi:E3 ubiquitin-protein ligase MARCH6
LNFKDSDIFTFSAASHESLLTLGSLVRGIVTSIGQALAYPFTGGLSLTLTNIWVTLLAVLQGAWQFILAMPSLVMKPDTWVISLEVAKRSTPLNPELSAWSGSDRFWATIAGYTTLCILGAMYVKRGTPFSTGPVGREWETAFIDILYQAGGVMKVILIISIEMLVFPLYCGLLLDAALLPVFDNATITSRAQFTARSPLTSVFVHWFVGTCYMFHFALFVSMCRKIMRKGVLCKFQPSYQSGSTLTSADFIRDPDDPTFHPVRDVLERNVITQLRKILFSALVYGALVVVCLGGVVWGISLACRGVLPIHWSSNEPVLEFPIDLLFYNFLMPLAVKFFKPSDGLHAMYRWWFRTCARMLRLSWFLFDERKVDEEGYNVRRSWRDVIKGVKGDPSKVVKTDDPREPFTEDPKMDAYFCRDGRYVRAPASDQVRLPTGSDIFLQVDENNNRVDGKWDRPDGVHGRESRLYKQVYVPPHFRLRICAFILSIWVFAALTGVCITVVPLVFGRHIFSLLLPSDIRKNDVYAFSIGIYILGSALYGVLHLRTWTRYLISSLALTRETPNNVLRRVMKVTSRVARLLWTYAAFIFVLPTLFAFVVEFYAIVPLHTYFSSSNEPHTIHFVQSWTLGLLYVKLTSRVILYYSDSLPAISLRAITRDGYLNPDAKLATRAFILPGTILMSFALFWPYCIARLAMLTIFRNATDEQTVMVYRYVYPAVLATAFCCWLGVLMVGMLQIWRSRIRDEVYLIGERLHNFGERKTTGNGVGIGVRRIET